MSEPTESAMALSAFEAKEYGECAERLRAMCPESEGVGPGSSPELRRVAFNAAVAEWYADGRRDVRAFRDKLWRLVGRPWPEAPDPPDDSAAEAPFHYSCALALYKARHYGRARRSLERLAALRESFPDRTLARHVLLLLIEVYLCCRAPEKAIALADATRAEFESGPAECRDLLRRLTLRADPTGRRRAVPHPQPHPNASIEWLVLRAHQQYADGNPRAALATLAQHGRCPDADADSPNADDVWAALNNDLGVVYAAMKKYHLSAKYMQQALREHLKFANENPSATDPAKDRPLYVFNLGISLLKSGRPEDAFECLVEASRHYPNNPRIWYRLAECCVVHHNKNDRRENVVRKVGSGPNAKLLPGQSKDGYVISGESYAIPTLTLEFAALCLMNAITLLPHREPSAEFAHRTGPSGPMNYAQYCDLKNSALLLYAYVSLRLNDPTAALEHCATLLSHPAGPGQSALAHLYSAEALISLDRITEAAEHLNPTIVHGHASKMGLNLNDAIGFAVCLNNAVCQAVRGDLKSSRSILQPINSSPRALPLQLYLEMCDGNIDNCRVLLRKFTRVPS